MFNPAIQFRKSINNIEGGIFLYLLSTIALFMGLLFIFLYHVLKFNFYIPSLPCVIHDYLHLYCPGCGGTRAVKALLNFDLVKSFLCNPFVLYLVGIFLYYYIGSTVTLLTKFKVVVFHFRFWMIYGGLALFIINCIIRNILAVYYGIDYLGDIKIYW
ncbi:MULTISPECIES: DUF2752 domain-containing protein [unclassified Clostridium]|uniref:DUF2752 domain-containing protein n=1 Tax=unclassified Clostridium TaxID=2614128 RepID=UPI0002980EEF|nr:MULTISPECIES: DUF2752 domain-containing protein [unclassified Clostridium]EKQ56029.1 MAG: Protein of unknown function (DUF2752) [Clostridium sp. Maddingley MBC34-26]